MSCSPHDCSPAAMTKAHFCSLAVMTKIQLPGAPMSVQTCLWTAGGVDQLLQLM